MFKFELTQNVTISASQENGLIVGRAEYSHAENIYLIRYKAADGGALESWCSESALSE